MEWRPVKGFEGDYSVSDTGIVFSHIYNRPISTKHNNRGYVQVHLRSADGVKMKLVHRLVADAFIPNPNEHPQVNHLDENKDNNHVSNLEWCTNMYNRHHGTGIQRMAMHHDYERIMAKLRKPIECYDSTGALVKCYTCASKAAADVGITKDAIAARCRKKRVQPDGLIWQYA